MRLKTRWSAIFGAELYTATLAFINQLHWMSLIVQSTECQLRWLNGHAPRGPLRPCKACEGLRALQPQGF